MKGDKVMTLNEYFENTAGMGVLATADRDGLVNAAMYARPHVIDEANIALIMSDRLSHLNLQSNPPGPLPLQGGGGLSRGRRLYLTKTKEERGQPPHPADQEAHVP